jgi:alanine dehydrogenase
MARDAALARGLNTDEGTVVNPVVADAVAEH